MQKISHMNSKNLQQKNWKGCRRQDCTFEHFLKNPYIVNELVGIDDGKHKHHTLRYFFFSLLLLSSMQISHVFSS